VSLEGLELPPTHVDLYGLALVYLAVALAHQGHPDQARSRIQQAATRAARSERPFDRSFVAQGACFVYLALRDTERLATTATEAIESDFPAIAAIGRLSGGRVMSANGDRGRAVDIMRQAIEAYRATGQRIGLPLMLWALAETHADAGETAAALACIAEGRSVAESSGEVRFLAEFHRLEGTVSAAEGDPRAAERRVERAITVAREQGAGWWELRATASLARLALQRNARASIRRTAGEDLTRLLLSFTEGTDLPDVSDALDLVAQCGDRG
jgi:hypothetical protein